MAGSIADDALARQAWLDYAKAAGIVLVVIGHANRSIERSGLDWPESLRIADQLIYSFHMPLFFVLAGYASTLSRRRSVAGFLVGTWWGVIMPYLLWSAVWIGLKAALPEYANTPLDLMKLWSILWTPVEHFWFLYNLLIARVLWFAMTAGTLRLGWVALGTIAFGAAYTANTLAADVLYYGVGVLVLRPLITMDMRPAVLAAGIALAAALWLALTLRPASESFSGLRMIAALLASGVVILLSFAVPTPRTLTLRVIAFVGEASLVLYLLHVIVAAAARSGLKASGYLDTSTLLVVATVAGLVGPLLIQVLALKLNAWTGQKLSQWAGFGSLSRSSYLDLSLRGLR